jgi:hypothetical protein
VWGNRVRGSSVWQSARSCARRCGAACCRAGASRTALGYNRCLGVRAPTALGREPVRERPQELEDTRRFFRAGCRGWGIGRLVMPDAENAHNRSLLRGMRRSRGRPISQPASAYYQSVRGWVGASDSGGLTLPLRLTNLTRSSNWWLSPDSPLIRATGVPVFRIHA